MDRIPLEDLALLEVLTRISQGEEAGPDSEVETRLIASGLVQPGPDALALTPAGVALCKSLQHRVAADQLSHGGLAGADAPAPDAGEPPAA